MSDSGSVPTRSAGTLLARRQGADDRPRAAGDVMVGEDVALGADDGAAAGGLTLHLATVLVIDRDDMDADEARRHVRDRGIDRGALGREPVPAPAAEPRPWQTAAIRTSRRLEQHASIVSRPERAQELATRFCATRRRYAAVERTSSIGAMSRRMRVARRLDHHQVDAARAQQIFGRAAPHRRRRDRAEGDANVVDDAAAQRRGGGETDLRDRLRPPRADLAVVRRPARGGRAAAESRR